MKTKAKAKRRGVRLNKPQDVRRLLSRLINQHLAGDLSADSLRAVTYASTTILKVFEIGDIAERLEAVEDALEITN